jgi:hypothetical protein
MPADGFRPAPRFHPADDPAQPGLVCRGFHALCLSPAAVMTKGPSPASKDRHGPSENTMKPIHRFALAVPLLTAALFVSWLWWSSRSLATRSSQELIQSLATEHGWFQTPSGRDGSTSHYLTTRPRSCQELSSLPRLSPYAHRWEGVIFVEPPENNCSTLHEEESRYWCLTRQGFLLFGDPEMIQQAADFLNR